MKRAAWLGIIALALAGCSSEGGGTASLKGPVTLEKSAPVKLMLLEELESGVTPEGEEVTFMVAEDVRGPDGTVAIPKGSTATGTISWSRRADTVSALTNRPARLAVKLVSVKAIDGSPIPIDAAVEDDDAFHFTRGNTGRTELASRIEELWRSEEGKKLLTEVEEVLQKGQSLNTPENAEILRQAVEKLELPRAAEMLKQGKLGEVQGLVDKLKRGEGLTELALQNVTGIAAVMELANLARDVGHKLGDVVRGRNIKAYVGTPVEAVISQTTTIKP